MATSSNVKAPVLTAGAKGNYLAGRVKQYAGVMVQRAGDVMAGAKQVMERAGTGKGGLNNLKHAIRRLDEVSRTARGTERTEALKRWLGALRELGKGGKGTANAAGGSTGESAAQEDGTTPDPAPAQSEADSGELNEGVKNTDGTEPLANASPSSNVAAVLFYDESGEEPFTFRDVFLRSSALENVIVSLVREAPTEADLALVSELMGLCMMGSAESHSAFLKAVVRLSEVHASYSEVKLSQEELAQMVATAVTGLKYDSEAERLETLSAKLKAHLEAIDLSAGSSVPEAFSLALKFADASRQREAILTKLGDDEVRRTTKIETTMSISKDLLGKLPDFETRVKECQQQLQDSGKFRTSKSEEVLSAEKIISDELQVLHKRRIKLEEELEQVNGAIAAATRRHIEIQEEKEQFDLLSSNLANRLTAEEEGLHLLMRQHTDDAKVLDEWKGFLEETWKLQQAGRVEEEREAKEAGTDAQDRLWKVASKHLGGLRDETRRCWLHFKSERAKLEESLGFAGVSQQPSDPGPEGARRGGLPADEGYRLAEFRLKNALREMEKAKAEVAVRTSGMANPGAGSNSEHFDAIQGVIAEIDELRKEYSLMKRSASEGFAHGDQANPPSHTIE